MSVAVRPVPSRAPGPQSRWGQPIALAAAILFVISSAFPVVAGLSKNTASFPKWWGTLDVALAFVLVILVFVVLKIAEGREDRQVVEISYRAYRVLNHGILGMCVVFFLFGDRIVWINCLTGFAWRTWLFVYALPAWLTVWKTKPGGLPDSAE